GNVLKMSADVGVVWYFDHKDGSYHVSLRSDGENVDVSEVAKHFGGGGHPGASGLRWPATKSIEEIFDEPGKEPEDTEEDLGGSGEAEGPITHTSGSS
ncbi:MAG: DHHA1 domain-containing protein, partial [Candidatus Thorarchaeota archaeon]